jgi:hypothetical protein
MKVLELRQLLEYAAGNLLGTYSRPDGSKIKAFYVVPPQIPKEWKIEGIELTISNEPNYQPSALIGNVLNRKSWKAVARSYDDSSLEPLIQSIIQVVPTVNVVRVPATDNTWSQVTFTIPDYELLQMLPLS